MNNLANEITQSNDFETYYVWFGLWSDAYETVKARSYEHAISLAARECKGLHNGEYQHARVKCPSFPKTIHERIVRIGFDGSIYH